MVICLERGADLHMAQLIPLPLTVFCFSKIQIGFTFLVPARLGSPGKRAIKRVCVCLSVSLYLGFYLEYKKLPGISLSQFPCHLPYLLDLGYVRIMQNKFHSYLTPALPSVL